MEYLLSTNTYCAMQSSDELAIETDHLSFGFSKGKSVVHNINLRIPKGAIYGFLGPNGAGKTTTIRLLLNLLKPGKGFVRVFGCQISRDHKVILSRMGVLIETPSLYEHLTGFDNLWIAARLRNITKARVLEVLEIVRLSPAAEKYVKNYSLGMKQRLGLALALLPSPDLLILDEPVNGLDPNGIIEVRELLRELNEKHNVTILISSHLLPEIEKLVSHIGIIDQGDMLFQGSLKELQGIRRSISFIEIDTSENLLAIKIISENNHTVRQGSTYLEVQFENKYQVADIVSLLVSAGFQVYRAQLIESTLEQTFLSILNQHRRNDDTSLNGIY